MAAAVLPFADTRHFGHVHDDHVLRGASSLVTDGRANLEDLWGADFFGTYDEPRGQSGYWRPLVTLGSRLEVILAGGSTQGYLWLGHVITVLCHLAATLALWRLLLALGCTWQVAVLASALFGLHPIHVENVSWTSGRVDSLSAAWGWAGTALWLRGRGRGFQAAAGFACLLLAPLCKETAALLLVLAPVAGRKMGMSWGRSLLIPALALVTTVVLRAFSFGLVHELPAEAFTGPESLTSRWATWLSIQPDLLRFAIWPGPTSPIHPVNAAANFSAPGVSAGLALLLALSALGFWIVWRRSAAAAYVMLLALGTTYLLAPWVRFPTGFSEVAGPLYERYLYVAAAAPALLLGWVIARQIGAASWRVPLVIVLAILCIGPVTASRTLAWSSDIHFAQAGLRTAPASANLWAHLGTAYLENYRMSGEPQESAAALEAYDRALALDSLHTRAAVNRFITLVLSERGPEAMGQATVLLSRWPADPFVLHNVAAWHEAEGRLETAAELLDRELQTDRPHPETAERLEALLQRLEAQEGRGAGR